MKNGARSTQSIDSRILAAIQGRGRVPCSFRRTSSTWAAARPSISPHVEGRVVLVTLVDHVLVSHIRTGGVGDRGSLFGCRVSVRLTASFPRPDLPG